MATLPGVTRWGGAVLLALTLFCVQLPVSDAKHPKISVAQTWNEACSGFCLRHQNKRDGREYVTRNYRVLQEYLPLWNYFNRATRRQADFAVAKYLRAEPRGGEVLGIGGDNYFDFFDLSNASFTFAEPPLVNCMDMPYDDGIFDYVILSHVLAHVPEPMACMAEVHRVLKPGGIALVVAPSTYFVQNVPDDFWRLQPSAIDLIFMNFSRITFRGQWGNKEFIKHFVDHSQTQLSFYTKTMKKLADSGNDYRWPIMVWGAAQK